MHDDGDIGRPVHHSIDPYEATRSRTPRKRSEPTQAVRDLIESITTKYPRLDADRVREIARDTRHDVTLDDVQLVMDDLRRGVRGPSVRRRGL